MDMLQLGSLALDLTTIAFLFYTSVFSELQITTAYWVETLARLSQPHYYHSCSEEY